MHLIAFTILVSHFMNRNVSLNLRRMFVATVASVALLSLAVVLIRGYLDVSFKQSFSKERLVTERELVSFRQQLMLKLFPLSWMIRVRIPIRFGKGKLALTGSNSGA